MYDTRIAEEEWSDTLLSAVAHPDHWDVIIMSKCVRGHDARRHFLLPYALEPILNSKQPRQIHTIKFKANILMNENNINTIKNEELTESFYFYQYTNSILTAGIYVCVCAGLRCVWISPRRPVFFSSLLLPSCRFVNFFLSLGDSYSHIVRDVAFLYLCMTHVFL